MSEKVNFQTLADDLKRLTEERAQLETQRSILNRDRTENMNALNQNEKARVELGKRIEAALALPKPIERSFIR